MANHLSSPHPSSTPRRKPSPPHLAAALTLCALASLLTVPTTRAAEKITYEDHIFPIFEQSCLNCHNPDKQKGGLDLSNYPGALRGGSGGKIAEPGDGAGSVLFASVTHTNENKMPPKGDKISKPQADLIRAWVDGGLLETKDSTAKKRRGPKIDLSIKIDPNAKPDGPPPMPVHLSLEPITVTKRTTTVADLATSPWAPLLAITGQKQILLYHTDSLRLAAVLPYDAGQPETLSFHPSGKYLLAGGGVPGKSGTTITWDITTGQELMRNGKEFDSVLGASLRLDLGGVAIGGPSRLIKLWDTQAAEQLKSIKKHTDWITSLAYSPDGVLLATADRSGGVWVWEAGTGNEFHTLRAHQKGVTTVRWRADSNILATASEDGQVLFWEMNNGKQVKKIAAHAGGVLAFDYSRDGHFITSGRDKKVKIWKPDFNLKKELPTFSELIVEVAFSHDGKRFFTADWNGTVTVWDSESFAKIGELSTNPPTIANRVASLEKQLAALPAELNTAQGKLTAAELALTKARENHQTAIKKHKDTQANIARLQKERTTLNEESKQLEQRHKEIAAARNKHMGELDQARKKLQQHRVALTKAQEDLAALGPPKDHDIDGQLAAEATKWKQEAEKSPDDAGLKRRAEEAAQRSADHHQKLAASQKERQSATARVTQLDDQLDGFQQSLTSAENRWKQSEPEWNNIETRRGQITTRRQQIDPELPRLTKLVPDLARAIKPAQEQIPAQEKALAPAKTKHASIKTRQANTHKNLLFWQAAAVNHHAIDANTHHLTLKNQQDHDVATLAKLNTSLTSLHQQLSPTPDQPTPNDATRQKHEADLQALTAEIASLRTAIDTRTPQLAKLSQKAQTLKAQYLKLTP